MWSDMVQGPIQEQHVGLAGRVVLLGVPVKLNLNISHCITGMVVAYSSHLRSPSCCSPTLITILYFAGTDGLKNR